MRVILEQEEFLEFANTNSSPALLEFDCDAMTHSLPLMLMFITVGDDAEFTAADKLVYMYLHRTAACPQFVRKNKEMYQHTIVIIRGIYDLMEREMPTLEGAVRS